MTSVNIYTKSHRSSDYCPGNDSESLNELINEILASVCTLHATRNFGCGTTTPLPQTQDWSFPGTSAKQQGHVT